MPREAQPPAGPKFKVKLKSANGKVHLAEEVFGKSRPVYYVTLCVRFSDRDNGRWSGADWGKNPVSPEEEVTCKVCLSRIVGTSTGVYDYNHSRFKAAVKKWEEEGAQATFEANFPDEDYDEWNKQREENLSL
ncbi:MAG: hypothetical protein ACYTFW_12560 [Planctomycetota bacterium]|jgi:hypothetical protein